MADLDLSKDPGEPVQLRPLHGGRHNIPPEVLAHHQRERILAALAATVAEHGYNATTISQIAAAASVSKRTFYQHFSGKQECFLAAYDALDDYLASVLREAEGSHSDWPGRVIATFAPLIEFLASRPAFARLYLVEAFAVGQAMAARRAQTARRFISLLEPGRRYGGVDPDLAEGMEEGLVGGIFTLLSRRIVAGEADHLDRFTPAVCEFALAPYVGNERARALIAEQA